MQTYGIDRDIVSWAQPEILCAIQYTLQKNFETATDNPIQAWSTDEAWKIAYDEIFHQAMRDVALAATQQLMRKS